LRFLGGVTGFVVEHPGLGAAAAPSFLASDFLALGPVGIGYALAQRHDLVEQQATGDEPVETLLTGGLAFHADVRGPMM
jgi:hypothetical protein